MEFLESQDIKNGVNAFVDDNQNLVLFYIDKTIEPREKRGYLQPK